MIRLDSRGSFNHSQDNPWCQTRFLKHEENNAFESEGLAIQALPQT